MVALLAFTSPNLDICAFVTPDQFAQLFPGQLPLLSCFLNGFGNKLPFQQFVFDWPFVGFPDNNLILHFPIPKNMWFIFWGVYVYCHFVSYISAAEQFLSAPLIPLYPCSSQVVFRRPCLSVNARKRYWRPWYWVSWIHDISLFSTVEQFGSCSSCARLILKAFSKNVFVEGL